MHVGSIQLVICRRRCRKILMCWLGEREGLSLCSLLKPASEGGGLGLVGLGSMVAGGDRGRRLTLKCHPADLRAAFEGQKNFETVLEL